MKEIIFRIKNDLTNVFDELFLWFESKDELLDYLPVNGGWNIRELLEHVSLTNHFLLILIRKGVTKSKELAKHEDFEKVLEEYVFDWDGLKVIGEHKSFEWNRPKHMEPTGILSLNEIELTLKEQILECLSLLDQVPNGEGVLYKTMMSVNDLGKIDVYHYIYFLVQHLNRHLTQIKNVRTEFENLK